MPQRLCQRSYSRLILFIMLSVLGALSPKAGHAYEISKPDGTVFVHFAFPDKVEAGGMPDRDDLKFFRKIKGKWVKCSRLKNADNYFVGLYRSEEAAYKTFLTPGEWRFTCTPTFSFPYAWDVRFVVGRKSITERIRAKERKTVKGTITVRSTDGRTGSTWLYTNYEIGVMTPWRGKLYLYTKNRFPIPLGEPRELILWKDRPEVEIEVRKPPFAKRYYKGGRVLRRTFTAAELERGAEWELEPMSVTGRIRILLPMPGGRKPFTPARFARLTGGDPEEAKDSQDQLLLFSTKEHAEQYHLGHVREGASFDPAEGEFRYYCISPDERVYVPAMTNFGGVQRLPLRNVPEDGFVFGELNDNTLSVVLEPTPRKQFELSGRVSGAKGDLPGTVILVQDAKGEGEPQRLALTQEGAFTGQFSEGAYRVRAVSRTAASRDVEVRLTEARELSLRLEPLPSLRIELEVDDIEGPYQANATLVRDAAKGRRLRRQPLAMRAPTSIRGLHPGPYLLHVATTTRAKTEEGYKYTTRFAMRSVRIKERKNTVKFPVKTGFEQDVTLADLPEAMANAQGHVLQLWYIGDMAAVRAGRSMLPLHDGGTEEVSIPMPGRYVLELVEITDMPTRKAGREMDARFGKAIYSKAVEFNQGKEVEVVWRRESLHKANLMSHTRAKPDLIQEEE